jgi:DNA polymerase-4
VAAEVFATARGLFDALGLDRARLRLIGVRVEGLAVAETAPRQMLLGDRVHGRREAEQAADRAAARFGSGAVRPASLVPDHPDSRRTDLDGR